jgi:endothelin-converting enzyme/putative endopeptidase
MALGPAWGQTPPTPAPDPVDKGKPAVVPGFDPAAMDRTADPCQAFYQFACGGWLAKNPVPADRSRYGRFDELQERNQVALKTILEKVSAQKAAKDSVDQRIGDHYAACMDEKGVEARGLQPVKPVLDRIAALASKEEVAAEVARLHSEGVPVLFGFGAQPDFKDASRNIAAIDQGGLGLPDRDYYLKDEARFADVRNAYVPHIQKMFELAGDAPDKAAAEARNVVDMETALAKDSLERVKRRDPVNRYHKMTRDELKALAPHYDWNRYFTGLPWPAFTDLNVGWPDFFKGLDGQLASADLPAWKTYLRWHVLRTAAPMLPAAFVQENFNFYGKTLTGAKELRPRWKRCVDRVDTDLGEALGQRYVEATFGAEGKQRMAVMVAALEKALERDIKDLPWMTPTTKDAAHKKLAAVANKVGYPERWKDYAGVAISRDDLLGNVRRAQAWEIKRDLGKVGKPVDKTEWGMTPPTVNAYYSPLQNNINFPAGILQPPFFDRVQDDAVNFGGIGAVIGHELTHGFDDQGRKFAPNGDLSDWWTEEDGREFEKRASCIADQYSSYTATGDVKLNGRLTLGENTADNGGLRIAYMALQDTIAGKKVPLKDGFTPEQRIFLGWGQIWCQNETEESSKLRAQTDPHSPGRYRVEGTISNMPEFQKAFSCAAGSKMVRENPCRVW